MSCRTARSFGAKANRNIQINSGPAYPSRAAFIASQFQTPPLPVVNTTDYFYDCLSQKVSWRWRASGIGKLRTSCDTITCYLTRLLGSNQYTISGIIDFDLSGGLIKNVYSEFNTAVFLVDLGVKSCVPPPPQQ